jgi:DNA-binding NarL/FixJ family response regulator
VPSIPTVTQRDTRTASPTAAERSGSFGHHVWSNQGIEKHALQGRSAGCRKRGQPPSDSLRVAVLASHPLVASYLRDIVVSVGIDKNSAIVSDQHPDSTAFLPWTRYVFIIDLHGLLLPVDTYLDLFKSRVELYSFLAVDCRKPPAEIAELLLEGFHGFISYDSMSETVSPAIAAINDGQIWAEPQAIGLYMKLSSHQPLLGFEILTKRERQIRDLLQRRYSNKEIAVSLGISESTVKFHVSNVMSKLSASGRKQLSEPVLPVAAEA